MDAEAMPAKNDHPRPAKVLRGPWKLSPIVRRRVFRLGLAAVLALFASGAHGRDAEDLAAIDHMMEDLSHAEMPADPSAEPVDEDEVTFPVNAFVVVGNSLFSEQRLGEILAPFGGPKKTAGDVELARAALEAFYHEAGYPTVMVSIPQQLVEGGTVTLEVVEATVGKVKVTGNRYYRAQRVLQRVPSFTPGEILWVPRLQEELNKANSNPSLKITPSIAPGDEPGTVDVELEVKDSFPLHGHVELSNRFSPNTSELRLNGLVSFDNLWQLDHSASFQYQTSPLDTEEVQVIATSYVMPTPWNEKHTVALYALWTDSASAFGTGFNTVGKGAMVGGRYVLPLRPYRKYSHSVTLGADYKDFEDTLDFGADAALDNTPIKYLPFSVAYSASLPDEWGLTQFSGGINGVFRGLVTNPDEFENKRFKARGNYLYATAGVERIQRLPADWSLYLKADGQMSDQPLISNEQYAAGGMDSVRGYLESEVLGDDAFHLTVELSGPELAGLLKLGGKVSGTPYAFYDQASLWIQDELPAQNDDLFINGAGVGIRGNVTRFFNYDLCWAVALSEADHTESGENRFHFQVKFRF
jgi:hemolysin activation/secretion protein